MSLWHRRDPETQRCKDCGRLPSQSPSYDEECPSRLRAALDASGVLLREAHDHGYLSATVDLTEWALANPRSIAVFEGNEAESFAAWLSETAGRSDP